MSEITALMGIAFALLVGAASPGPSFIFVSRLSAAESRANGAAAALGMGCGGATYAALALAGMAAFFNHVPAAYAVLKFAGGLYLCYVAVRLWRSSVEVDTSRVRSSAEARTPLSALSAGFLVQMSNPKTAIVYAAVFAAMLPESPPVWLSVTLLAVVFLVETTWYAAVATLFSSRRPRDAYLASRRFIDRVAALLLATIGGKLVAESLEAAVTSPSREQVSATWKLDDL